MSEDLPLMIAADHPTVAALTVAIQSGDVTALRELLHREPGLTQARFGSDAMSRTVLHIATDWPGNFPNVAEVIRTLIAAGADVDARFAGPHRETALHWAASGNDVDAIAALLESGADIEADGAVIGGGTPLFDAVAFGQWDAAQLLVDRGAKVALWHAAALGRMDLLESLLAAGANPGPSREDLTNALWSAALGGQQPAAEVLVEHGADPTWIGHDHLTSAQVADREGHTALALWLRSL